MFRKLIALSLPRGVAALQQQHRCTSNNDTAVAAVDDTPKHDSSGVSSGTQPAGELKAPPPRLPDTVANLPFRVQMIELKRWCRGIAQRPSCKADAKIVLERAIPSDAEAFKEWITEENATTALNGASFFEIDIPSQGAIVAWAKDHIAAFKEPFNAATAAISLLHLEAKNESTADLLRRKVVPILRERLPQLFKDAFHTAVKLFQQLGIQDPDLWESVCIEIKRREAEVVARDGNAVRLFACVARHAPDNKVTSELFDFLIGRITFLKSYDFSTFLCAAERWGKVSLTDALRLLERQGERTHQNNARDLGICFPSATRLGRALEAGALTPGDRLKLAQHLHFVFDACENHVYRSMDPSVPERYWDKPTDIIMTLYAYETSQRVAPQLYARFADYCVDHALVMDGREVAMSIGIQRRANVLSPAFVSRVLPRITAAIEAESVTLEEMSHTAVGLLACPVPGSDAVLGSIKKYVKNHWSSAEADGAKVIIGGHPAAKPCAAANLTLLFPGDALFTSVDLAPVPVRQLVDLRRQASSAPKVKSRFDVELEKRLQNKTMTDADIALVAQSAAKPDDPLRKPAQSYITELLALPEWGPYHLDLLAASVKLDKSAYAKQAVELARLLAVSPQQLVLVLRKIVPLLPADDEGLRTLVADAAEQLLRSSFSSSLAFYRVTRGTAHQMSDGWFKSFFTSLCLRHVKRCELADAAYIFDALVHHKLRDDVEVKKAAAEFIATLVTRLNEGARLRTTNATAADTELLIAAVNKFDASISTDALTQHMKAIQKEKATGDAPSSNTSVKHKHSKTEAKGPSEDAPSKTARGSGRLPKKVSTSAKGSSKKATAASKKGAKVTPKKAPLKVARKK